jgi:large subunit ribosomal protein L4
MTAVTVQAPSGDTMAKKRTIELPDAVFDVQTNIPLIHQVVVAQLAAARQGTASTKTRAEVAGGGRKPYRQKGTGRARQGSTRAPQFAGGGVVHGPKPRSYEQRTPKKMKAAALRGALSDRARNGRIHVVSSLVEGDAPSTKGATTALAAIADTANVLVVALREDVNTWLSLRNNPAVHMLEPGQLNTYDVLISDDVVFLEDALFAFLDGKASVEDLADEDETADEAIEDLESDGDEQSEAVDSVDDADDESDDESDDDESGDSDDDEVK